MKRLLLSLLLFCALARAQTTELMFAEGGNTKISSTYGLGYDYKRHGPPQQIYAGNIRRLHHSATPRCPAC